MSETYNISYSRLELPRRIFYLSVSKKGGVLLVVIIFVKNKNSGFVLSELLFGSIDHEMKFFEPSMPSESLELLLLIPLRIVLKPSQRYRVSHLKLT